MEYGCRCDKMASHDPVSLHLYKEIEQLKAQLFQRDRHIVQMETAVMNHATKFPQGEWEALQETLRFWQDKYERLFESHRKLQKVNQGLEDKLLRIADKFESDKSALTRDLADVTEKLVEARVALAELEDENEKYKNDCNVAIQLLQLKPSNFVSHKINSLPSDMQEKVRQFMSNTNSHRRSKSTPSHAIIDEAMPLNGSATNAASTANGAKIIRVPISTFPPTAMVYSVNKLDMTGTATEPNGGTPDRVSAAIMAKVLEERAKERLYKQQGRANSKCSSCRNRRASVPYIDQATETSHGEINPTECLMDMNNVSWSRSRNGSMSSMNSYSEDLIQWNNFNGNGNSAASSSLSSSTSTLSSGSTAQFNKTTATAFRKCSETMII